MDKIIEVASLQEYISAIEKINSGEYYYRGEPSIKYDQILASAFRTYEKLFKKREYEYIDYRKILAEYYSEIAHELNSIERENFIFYAQHHGLPTSLIDITANPLTALYFACSTNFEENEGKVHLFAKKYTIDMSDYNHLEDITFNQFLFDNEITLKIFEKLYNLNKDIKEEIIRRYLNDLGKKTNQLYNLIEENYKDHNAYIFDEIIKKVCELNLDEYDSTKKFISEFDSFFEINFKNNPSKKKFRVALGQKNKPYFFELHSSKYMKDKLALIIMFLTQIQFDYLYFDTQHRKLLPSEYSKLTDRYDVYFPNIVVHPSVKFERMKSQEGSFLYQIAKYNAPTGEYKGFSKITSDLQIVIKDKKRIFKALDTMGINQKNLFGDHDNIASYLKRNRLYD